MLIFARHGNTFEAGQTPVWVGARTDLPLTAEGRAQAQRAANWLALNNLKPDQIIAGPLKRTREFASIVAASQNEVFIDDRLKELDYGLWEGLSAEEIKEHFGPEELTAWEEHGQWPIHAQWPEKEADVRQRLTSILDEYKQNAFSKNIFLCTSNGILRLIKSIVEKKPATKEAKVAPGNLCILEPTDAGYSIQTWNLKPN